MKLLLVRLYNRLFSRALGTLHLHAGGRISRQRRGESFKSYLFRDARKS